MEAPQTPEWLEFLEQEDVTFIKRFILASGSLKDLAAAYEVSYPTLRLRLDRLIAKIRVLDSHTVQDDHERLLRALFAEGRLDSESFKKLLRTYNEQKKATS